LKIRVARVLLPLIILIIALTPAVVFAETETATGTQPDIGLLPDGKVIVTEPEASPATTVKPPVTSSTKILRDGTVVTTSATTVTTVAQPQPADAKTGAIKAAAPATTQRSGTATADENETVVVQGEQIKNPATMSEETLPLTGIDLKPYFAIAILLIILGRATYTKATSRP